MLEIWLNSRSTTRDSAPHSAAYSQRTYSLIAFSHALEPDQRTDRVIAEAWDATFNATDPGTRGSGPARGKPPRQEQDAIFDELGYPRQTKASVFLIMS